MSSEPLDLLDLTASIREWAAELGFQQLGITDTDLSEDAARLEAYLAAGYHGEMAYMASHGSMRSRPEELLPGTLRVISVRMDYLPEDTQMAQVLAQPERAYISRYALGRDYHKLIRKRLQKLAEKITAVVGPFGHRAFVDSAPVLEKPLARKAGLGWMGKNTLILNRKAGSWFFLGELLIDLPLPIDAPNDRDHCGKCSACLDVCPTQAFVGERVLDARRCISYLTIELKEAIPEDLRPLIGNRVFGCDDCQLVCPWNRYAKVSPEKDFLPRNALDHASLRELFLWSEKQYLDATEGMALRRTRYPVFLRNMAVGLGNAPYDPLIIAALEQRLPEADAVLAEHVAWALAQQRARGAVTGKGDDA